MALFDRKPPQRERTPEERERDRAERAARRAARAGLPPSEAAAAAGRDAATDSGAPTAGSGAEEGSPAPVRQTTTPSAGDHSPAPEPTVPSHELLARLPRGGGAGSDRGAAARAARAEPALDALRRWACSGRGRLSPTGARSACRLRPRPVRRSAPARRTAPSSVLGDAPRRAGAPCDAAAEGSARRAASAQASRGSASRSRGFAAPGLPLRAARASGRHRACRGVVPALGVPAVPRRRRGQGRRSSSRRARASATAATCWRSAGVVSRGFFFKLRAKLDGPARDQVGHLPAAAKDMSYGAAFDALAAGPPKAPTTDITITEGRTIREVNRLLRRPRCAAATPAPSAASRVLRPQQYGAPRSARTLEGFLFPATYELRVGAPTSDLVTKQLRAFADNFATVNLRRRASAQKLTRLRRADHRLDDRARGRGGQGPPADLVRHLQPPARRASRSASTRRSATGSTTGRGRCASPSSTRAGAVQHALAPGPAADADRQPGPGLDPRRRRPGQRGLPLLRRQAVRLRRARLLSRPTPSSSGRPSATGGPRRPGRLAGRLLTGQMTGAPRGRPRLAGGAQPLAGDARGRVRRRWARGLALPAAARSRRELFAETRARAARRGFGAPT